MQGLRLILISIGILAIIVLLLHGGVWRYYKNKRVSKRWPIPVSGERFKQWCKQWKFFKGWFDCPQYDQNKQVHRICEPIFDARQEDCASALNIAFDSTQFGSVNSTAPHILAPCSDKADDMQATGAKEMMQTEAQEQPGREELSRTYHLLILYVVAYQKERLQGTRLMHSLTRLGCRYGERSIFHRYLHANGQGHVLFSVVNMVQPGTFEPQTMNQFTTPGVAFCMTIPTEGDTQQDFKLMLQAAQGLADDLSGIVLDDKRRMLTLQKTEHYRARIRHL